MSTKTLISTITAIAAFAASFGAVTPALAENGDLGETLPITDDFPLLSEPADDLALPYDDIMLSEDDTEINTENDVDTDAADDEQPTPTPETIEISTAEEFQTVFSEVPLNEEHTQDFTNKTYVLTNDIDFGGAEINRIGVCGYIDEFGEEETAYSPFNGVFDGNGHTLSNFKTTSVNDEELASLFYTLSGTVKNLNIDSYTIDLDLNYTLTTVDDDGNTSVAQKKVISIGGLAASIISGTITDCTLTNLDIEIRADDNYQSCIDVGGISGYCSNADIEYCGTSGRINLTATNSNNICIGGIGGEVANKSTINKCSSDMRINASAPLAVYAGGMASFVSTGNTISYLEYSGSIDITAGKSAIASGISGLTQSTISDSFVSESIISSSSPVQALVGGIVGYGVCVGTYILDCDVKDSELHATSETGSAYCGGIDGYGYPCPIYYSHVLDNCAITAIGKLAYCGGIFAANATAVVYGCSVSYTDVSSGSGTSASSAGGIGGYGSGTVTDTCDVAETTVSAYSSGSAVYAGGILARNYGHLGNSIASANVSAKTDSATAYASCGGIIGLSGSSSNSIISGATSGTFDVANCTFHGSDASLSVDANAGAFLGGIVALAYAPTIISDCKSELSSDKISTYSDSSVDLGGIVGYSLGGAVSECIATGGISAKCVGNVGGIVGNASGHEFYDKTNSPIVKRSLGSVIENCISDVDISVSEGQASLTAGGIAGYLIGSKNTTSTIKFTEGQPTVKNCASSGSVTFTLNEYSPKSHYVGGAIGYIVDAVAENVHSSGDVSVLTDVQLDEELESYNSNVYVGGFVGCIKENSLSVVDPLCTVSYCYTDSEIHYNGEYEFIKAGPFTESVQSNDNNENPIEPYIIGCFYAADKDSENAESTYVGTPVFAERSGDKTAYDGLDFNQTWTISENNAVLRLETSSIYDCSYTYDTTGTPTAISSLKLSKPVNGAKIYIALYDDLFGSDDVPSEVKVIEPTASSSYFEDITCNIAIPYGSEKIAVYYWQTGDDGMTPIMEKLILYPEGEPSDSDD